MQEEMTKKVIKVPIEIDITYVNKHWYAKRPQSNIKHYVIGFFQRGIKGHSHGVARIKAIPDNKPETIEKVVLENVAKGCIVYCQENILPASLKEHCEIHELKDSDGHTKGDLHINNVNNMWRDLKRLIKREHIHVSKKHLQLYCGEVAWRVNTNHMTPSERFADLMNVMSVNREKTTYQDLIK